jgi:hypothetical protein
LRGKLASALVGPLWLQAVVAGLLALCFISIMLFSLVLGLFAVARPEFGTGPILAPFAVLLVPTFWALARSWNSVNFIWVFGSWPDLGEASLSAADRPWLDAAFHGFDQAEFARALQVLERLPQESQMGRVKLARGRARLWAGQWEEGIADLEQGGEARRLVGWLRPRRFLGIPVWSLGPAVAKRAQHSGLAWLTLALVVAAAGGLLAPVSASIRNLVNAPAKSFDTSGFEPALARGRFVVHFHDPAFAASVLDLADDALDHDLAFLAEPGTLFGDQEIQLFLCENQDEYLKRSPYPAAWEAACAVPEKDSIYLYKPAQPGAISFQVTVAHELGHLIYHRMGIHGRNDSWLNEGLANYLGYKYAFDRNNLPRQAWLQEHEFSKLKGHFIPFGRFFEVEPHQLAQEQDVGIFYEQGSSVVYLLIEEYGRDSFLKFLKSYADGNGVDRALAMNYPSLPDLNALAAVWGLFFNDAATVPRQTSLGH